MAASGPTHVYVYYRVTGDRGEARASVARLFADVEHATGICGRLLARVGDANTWMEIYEPVARVAAFERALASAAHRHGAAAFAMDGRRHVERFSAVRAPADPR